MNRRALEGNRAQVLTEIRRRLAARRIELKRCQDEDRNGDELVEYADHNGMRLHLRLAADANECSLHFELGTVHALDTESNDSIRLSYPIGVPQDGGPVRHQWVFMRDITAPDSLALLKEVDEKLLLDCYTIDKWHGFHAAQTLRLGEQELMSPESEFFLSVFEKMLDRFLWSPPDLAA